MLIRPDTPVQVPFVCFSNNVSIFQKGQPVHMVIAVRTQGAALYKIGPLVHLVQYCQRQGWRNCGRPCDAGLQIASFLKATWSSTTSGGSLIPGLTSLAEGKDEVSSSAALHFQLDATQFTPGLLMSEDSSKHAEQGWVQSRHWEENCTRTAQHLCQDSSHSHHWVRNLEPRDGVNSLECHQTGLGSQLLFLGAHQLRGQNLSLA